jgi:hypothetical protein
MSAVSPIINSVPAKVLSPVNLNKQPPPNHPSQRVCSDAHHLLNTRLCVVKRRWRIRVGLVKPCSRQANEAGGEDGKLLLDH